MPTPSPNFLSLPYSTFRSIALRESEGSPIVGYARYVRVGDRHADTHSPDAYDEAMFNAMQTVYPSCEWDLSEEISSVEKLEVLKFRTRGTQDKEIHIMIHGEPNHERGGKAHTERATINVTLKDRESEFPPTLLVEVNDPYDLLTPIAVTENETRHFLSKKATV